MHSLQIVLQLKQPLFPLQYFNLMIQSATFSMQESQNILKTFLIDYDMTKVVQKFVKRQPIHLREHLKRIIRQTIINIEAHLFKAQKIPSLLLYDNQSDQMFEAFLNLKDIIPDSQKDNFYLNFVNMKSEGCRIMRFGRTDYHVSINSEQRERIYARFISYTEHHSLYKYAITRKDDDSILQTPPYSDPCKLFSQRDLQFVFKTFCMYKGDIVKMAQYFKSKGVEDQRFQIESLEQSIPNLMLIGYYMAHRKSAQANLTQPIRWTQFRQKYPLPQQCDLKSKVIWIRIAIRDDPEPNQLKWIHKIQKKKIIIKTPKIQPPKKGGNFDHKKWRKGRDSVLSRIKQQIKTSIIDNKSDVNSVDGQSNRTSNAKSIHNFHNSHKGSQRSQKLEKSVQRQVQKQNSQMKFMPPQQIDQEFQQQALSKRERQPEFLKKIQQQSQPERIMQQRDERDVVWQQIPDKSSSVQPDEHNLSSANLSGKFYSQKVIYDKPSQQASLRSQNPGRHKPKQIPYTKKSKGKNNQYADSEQEQNYDQYDPEASNSYGQQDDNEYESD